MDQFERMKVTRQAMNGRMCLMFGGIFLMFSAITSTIMYGINFFMTALEADKGTAEYVELLENAGVGSGLLKGIGICFIAVGIWEAVVGFLSVRNSNRVDKSRSKQTGGTGLGLAIVKHIVAQHQAQLQLESELGKGTKIRVLFPGKKQ